MKAALILALIGQCYARQGVVRQQSYVANTYAAPTYNQVYAVPYVEKVKFVAVEAQPSYEYYAALANAASRNYERFQEYAAQAPQQAITYSVPQPVGIPQQYAAPQQVYQAPAPAKAAPDPVQATPQQRYADPVRAVPSQQQQAYDAPSKAPPVQLQTPAKNPSSDRDIPPPIIQRPPMNYSATMGGEAEVPPPPVPRAPTALNDSNKVIHSVNTAFLSVLTKNCASCHTGQSSKGGFPIFDYPGRLANLTESDLQNIFGQVASNNMPFKRPMSQADRQALLRMLSGNVSMTASR